MSTRLTSTGAPWWTRAGVYQVYPRSFRDLNGDGTGDLAGIIAELPYIAALGVDAIWLSPFYPSPQRDSGYDVADPRAVEPAYGTLADAQLLIDEVHRRGLRIIVDVVPNHVSSEHPWFRAALAEAPGGPYRARFHFRDGSGPDGSLPPTNWISLFSGTAWTRITEPDGTPGQWYLHLFDSSQPDLNWTHPEVREDGLRTLRFWLDMGVDGFRVDVAPGLTKDMTYPDLDDPEGFMTALRLDLDDEDPQVEAMRARIANSPFFDRDEVQDVYREWRRVLDEYPGDRMAVAEAFVMPDRAARYVAPDTLHQVFNFFFLSVPWSAADIVAVIRRSIAGLGGATATWALSNHDTRRVASRLGEGEAGLHRARALALIAHALPGSVYVYQGEELGLPDAELADEARQDPVYFRSRGEQKGRDGARVPLPWAGDTPPFGFGSSAATWLPMPPDWQDMTVRVQEQDPWSTLAQYRAMLSIRRSHPGLVGDDLQVEELDGIVRIERGAGFACLANTTSSEVQLSVAGRLLVASDPAVAQSDGRLVLPADAGAWIQA